MLLRLQGLAVVKNITISPDEIVSLDINFSQDERAGFTLSGNRTVELSGEESDKILIKYGDSVDSLIGTLVNFSAKAVSTKFGSETQNTYEVTDIQYLHGAESKAQSITLSGVGNIRSITPVGELVLIHLYCTEKSKGEVLKGGRNLVVTGNSAKFFAKKGDELIGHNLEFSAKASTSTKQKGDGTTFYDNYTVTRNEIKWCQSSSQAA